MERSEHHETVVRWSPGAAIWMLGCTLLLGIVVAYCQYLSVREIKIWVSERISVESRRWQNIVEPQMSHFFEIVNRHGAKLDTLPPQQIWDNRESTRMNQQAIDGLNARLNELSEAARELAEEEKGASP